jgi:hypothetical protein
MGPTTAVRTDALPAIATVVGPGAFVSSGYLWAGLSRVQGLSEFLDGHEAIALASAILVWTLAGFAVDSLGSYVEYYLIDRTRADHKEMFAIWWRYLMLAWDREPVGQRYLRRVLVSFKFELNLCVATCLSAPSTLLLYFDGYLSGRTVLVVCYVLLACSGLLFYAARTSSKVLAETRLRLLKASVEAAEKKLESLDSQMSRLLSENVSR